MVPAARPSVSADVQFTLTRHTPEHRMPTTSPLAASDDALLSLLAPHLAAVVDGRLPVALTYGAYDSEGPSLAEAVARLADTAGLDEDDAEALLERVLEVARERPVTLLELGSGFGPEAGWSLHFALPLPDGTTAYLFDDDTGDLSGLVIDVQPGPLDEAHAHGLLARWVRHFVEEEGLEPDCLPFLFAAEARTDLKVRSPMLAAILGEDDTDPEELPFRTPGFWEIAE